MKTSLTYMDDGSVAGLEEGDQRHYRVSAINSAGAGTASPSVRSEATPAVALVASSEPMGLMAMAMGPTQIELTWTAPTDTSGDEITGYEIEYSDLAPADDTWTNWTDLNANTGNDETTYTDDGSDNDWRRRSDGGEHPAIPGEGDHRDHQRHRPHQRRFKRGRCDHG